MSRSRADHHLIADRYAKAAFALAEAAGVSEVVAGELRLLADAIESDIDVKRKMSHPLFSNETKAAMLTGFLQNKKANTITISTVAVLTRAGRLSALSALALAFSEKYAAARGIVRAVVISARPLNAVDVKAVSASIVKAMGKEIALEQQIDADVIGGIKLRIGSKELDMTLAGALSRTRRALEHVA